DLVLFGFTSFAESSQEFRVFTVALNYEPIAAVKIGAQITRVIADQSPAVFGGANRDTSVALRLQLTF
ncbi:MAG: hypothetical protein ACYS22_20060, partial [Planctomycetota bacterium]